MILIRKYAFVFTYRLREARGTINFFSYFSVWRIGSPTPTRGLKIEKKLFCSSRFPESKCKNKGIFSYQNHGDILNQSSKTMGIGYFGEFKPRGRRSSSEKTSWVQIFSYDKFRLIFDILNCLYLPLYVQKTG